jgi:U3 small nucleolar ribonucleoprotein component
MSNFNKYSFVKDLENELVELINAKEIEDYDQIQEYISQDIDNACIYYSDCFQIVMQLGAAEFGECKNIAELAYEALNQYVQDEINMSKLTELL